MKKTLLILATIAILSCTFLSCTKKNDSTSPNLENNNIENNSSEDISSDTESLTDDSLPLDSDTQASDVTENNNINNPNIENNNSSNNSTLSNNSSSNNNSQNDASDSNKTPEKNPESLSSDNPSTTSKDPNSELYTSNLGFSINFPPSWKGLYNINEDSSSLSVYFKQNTAGDYGQGLLFTIQQKTDDFDENTLDSIGNKRYIVAKNVLYVIGGPTDINFSPDSPDFESFETMHHEAGDVINTIKILN